MKNTTNNNIIVMNSRTEYTKHESWSYVEHRTKMQARIRAKPQKACTSWN